MKIISSLVLLVTSSLLIAGELPPNHCDQFFAYGKPKINQQTSDLCRISYYTQYDNINKIPFYSVEFLLKENINGAVKRSNKFIEDPNLDKSIRSTNKDYFKSGYDRGHLAPADDFSTDSASMIQSFYLSNMIPQRPDNNRGTWKSMEIRQRYWANQRDGLYVYSGASASKNEFIGNNVNVPTYLYKVIIDKNAKECIGFYIPNENNVSKNMNDYIATCDFIEKQVGINFTPEYNLNKYVIGQSFKMKVRK